jgi:hypothetical protein
MTELGFVLGQTYTRREIAEQLGGDWQSYLPHKNGRVVCGCFTLEMNPAAPDTVLVGNGPNVVKLAQMLNGQVEPIPVFLKQQSNAWKYVGEYSAEYVTDPAQVKPLAKAAGRSNVVGVLFLRGRGDDAARSADAYDEARERQLCMMAEGFDLGSFGEKGWTRDDLHER